jgi:hypothetical protein
MTINDLILSFSGAMLICVISAGLSARVARADLHQFDALMGLSPVPVACGDHNASAAKPLAPLAMRH